MIPFLSLIRPYSTLEVPKPRGVLAAYALRAPYPGKGPPRHLRASVANAAESFTNHEHTDVDLTAARGGAMCLTLPLKEGVRHTELPLTPLQGILPRLSFWA